MEGSQGEATQVRHSWLQIAQAKSTWKVADSRPTVQGSRALDAAGRTHRWRREGAGSGAGKRALSAPVRAGGARRSESRGSQERRGHSQMFLE